MFRLLIFMFSFSVEVLMMLLMLLVCIVCLVLWCLVGR